MSDWQTYFTPKEIRILRARAQKAAIEAMAIQNMRGHQPNPRLRPPLSKS